MSMHREWIATCDGPGCPASVTCPASMSKPDFGLYLNDAGWAAAPFTPQTYCFNHFALMPEPPKPSEAELERAAQKIAAAFAEHESRHQSRL